MRERKESPIGGKRADTSHICVGVGPFLAPEDYLRMTSSSNYRIETAKSRDIGKSSRPTLLLGSLSNEA